MKEVYKDCFNMLCGEKLGSGIHRDVFDCKIREDLVVKVEKADYRYFANVMEMSFWSNYQYCKEISKWLAPCEYMSPDGRILLQRKATPIEECRLPDRLPAFLTDTKPANFGAINGSVVCVDYAMHIVNVSTRMRKARWNI